MSVKSMIETMAMDAKQAAGRLRRVGRAKKDAGLEVMSKKLLEKETLIQKENEKDLVAARESGLSSAMIDRLALDAKTIRSMAEGLREVAGLPDPVGEVTRMWKRPNGLVVGQMRIPLGVIGFIYE
jgi:glutamate-5-semialdehyde dehydrogenase